jgi:hypothetical protein
VNTHNGIIGFFDILGYQNLLEKNEPEDIAQSVLEFLTNINDKITTNLKQILDETPDEIFSILEETIDHAVSIKDIVNNTIDSLKWILFSDTILLALPYDQKTEKPSVANWFAFLTICMHLQKEMFLNGLPVRGVINYGKFYLQDTCFAGRSIIEAYDLCNQLELAACIFSPKAQNEFSDFINRYFHENAKEISDNWVYEYLVPTKMGEFHYLVLKASVYNNDDSIMKQILSSFWGHNKDIPLSVQQKISNTEQWLNFLKMKNEKGKKNEKTE